MSQKPDNIFLNTPIGACTLVLVVAALFAPLYVSAHGANNEVSEEQAVQSLRERVEQLKQQMASVFMGENAETAEPQKTFYVVVQDDQSQESKPVKQTEEVVEVVIVRNAPRASVERKAFDSEEEPAPSFEERKRKTSYVAGGDDSVEEEPVAVVEEKEEPVTPVEEDEEPVASVEEEKEEVFDTGGTGSVEEEKAEPTTPAEEGDESADPVVEEVSDPAEEKEDPVTPAEEDEEPVAPVEKEREEEPAGPSEAKLFGDETRPRPETASHRISFSDMIGQRIVVTVKDEDGNIVEVVEVDDGDRSITVQGLEVGEEYTVIAESDGHCGAPRTITSGGETTIAFEKIEEHLYTYRWESDLRNREYECSSHTVHQKEITYVDGQETDSTVSAALILRESHNIVLSDDELTWSSDLARGLLRAVSAIPHKKGGETTFVLVDQELKNDIRVDKDTVFVSRHAFNNANPRMALVDGVRGVLFSHRVFHALVRFYTNDGADRRATEKILNEKFGVSLHAKNIMALTGEHEDNFQAFKNEEVLDLIASLVETPEGQHIIPGLAYLLRRKDGHPHPLYPGAAAVAWPRGADTDSYIEFMETAFYDPTSGVKQSEASIHRLILHEKTHFLWENVLSDALKEQWIDVAGWYENEDDIDGWSNRYTTSFVSPYAHKKNPDEDFAETIAYYITNPNRLLNVAPEKYDFVRTHVMQSSEYILTVREDLRFEVLNLFPNSDYPGKIRGVYVEARGRPDEDKRVSIDIALHNVPGVNDSARWARTRLMSESGSYQDIYLYPAGNNGHRLTGSVVIPKNTKSGYWRVDQIVVKDRVGNTRTESNVDFGFLLYINNAVEDLDAPAYVPGSLAIQVEKTTKWGRQVHKVTATWDIEEAGEMDNVYANFVSLSSPESYSRGAYGTAINNKAEVVYYITEYFPSGEYALNYLRMKDKALNIGSQYFSDDPAHEPQHVFVVETANPDAVPPTLDVNRITIKAEPVNKEQPDGKTRVTITYYAKDDLSGVGGVYYTLQDPNGKVTSGTHYHRNFHTHFFEGGDPTVYEEYVVKHLLPTGSAPGTWGLSGMTVEDKGGNIAVFDFTELLHFDLVNEQSGS